ncbi:hypothetical protein L596_000330 [Steinernema carpocapsae]|uniref:Uncharacterized protein n=1 Tax=Steinernema carpocapsae TaxID=34508 RepID=A0A4U8UHP5_STECR|nr:hypothetical protein L596_000330 [Steinernema carpocapsae]
MGNFLSDLRAYSISFREICVLGHCTPGNVTEVQPFDGTQDATQPVPETTEVQIMGQNARQGAVTIYHTHPPVFSHKPLPRLKTAKESRLPVDLIPGQLPDCEDREWIATPIESPDEIPVDLQDIKLDVSSDKCA